MRFPCVHAPATTPVQRLDVFFARPSQPYQPSPKGSSGRPAHCPFRGLLGVHSRYGLHTRAVTNSRHANRRLQPFRLLHDCSGCFRLERLPGGPRTHWKAPPFHGAHPERTPTAIPFSRSAEAAAKKFEVKAFMVACGHPSVGLTWNSNGTDLDEKKSVAAAFEMLKPWIRSCHINDLENEKKGAYPYCELFKLLRGIGLGNYVEATGGYPRERADITVHPGGRVDVVVGTLSSGQSHETTFAQCVAEWLGVPTKDGFVCGGDTGIGAAGAGSASGRAPGVAVLWGQQGSTAVQRCDRGLSDHTKGRGRWWRIQVQADEFGGRAREFRIAAGHITIQAMRFHLRLRPDPLHRRFTDALRLGQLAATPVGAAIRRSLPGAAHDASLHRGGHRARTAALVPRAKTRHAMLLKTLPPAGNGGRTGMEFLLNLAVAETIGQREHQASTKHVSGGQGSRLRPARQFLAFVVGENKQAAILCHAHWTRHNSLRYHRDSSLDAVSSDRTPRSCQLLSCTFLRASHEARQPAAVSTPQRSKKAGRPVVTGPPVRFTGSR